MSDRHLTVKQMVQVVDPMAESKKNSASKTPKTRKQILEERFEKLKPAQKEKFLEELERRKLRMDKKRDKEARRRKMAKSARKRNRMN